MIECQCNAWHTRSFLPTWLKCMLYHNKFKSVYVPICNKEFLKGSNLSIINIDVHWIFINFSWLYPFYLQFTNWTVFIYWCHNDLARHDLTSKWNRIESVKPTFQLEIVPKCVFLKDFICCSIIKRNHNYPQS